MQRSRTAPSRASVMSSMWERPSRRPAARSGSTSTPTTSQPDSAKATASGSPTYPSPTMPIFITVQTTLAGSVSREQVEIGTDHQTDQLLEVGFRLPAELALGLGRVADQQVDLGRTQILRVQP